MGSMLGGRRGWEAWNHTQPHLFMQLQISNQLLRLNVLIFAATLEQKTQTTLYSGRYRSRYGPKGYFVNAIEMVTILNKPLGSDILYLLTEIFHIKTRNDKIVSHDETQPSGSFRSAN